MSVLDKATGNTVDLTNTNWNLIVKAYA